MSVNDVVTPFEIGLKNRRHPASRSQHDTTPNCNRLTLTEAATTFADFNKIRRMQIVSNFVKINLFVLVFKGRSTVFFLVLVFKVALTTEQLFRFLRPLRNTRLSIRIAQYQEIGPIVFIISILLCTYFLHFFFKQKIKKKSSLSFSLSLWLSFEVATANLPCSIITTRANEIFSENEFSSSEKRVQQVSLIPLAVRGPNECDVCVCVYYNTTLRTIIDTRQADTNTPNQPKTERTKRSSFSFWEKRLRRSTKGRERNFLVRPCS